MNSPDGKGLNGPVCP